MMRQSEYVNDIVSSTAICSLSQTGLDRIMSLIINIPTQIGIELDVEQM